MNREGDKPSQLPTEPGTPGQLPTKPPGTPGQLPTLPTLPGTPEHPSVLPPEAGNLPSGPGGGRTVTRLPDTEERQDARQAEREAERIAKNAADLRAAIAANWEAVLAILPPSDAGMPYPEIVETCEKEGIKLKENELAATLSTLVNALRAARTVSQDVLGYRRLVQEEEMPVDTSVMRGLQDAGFLSKSVAGAAATWTLTPDEARCHTITFTGTITGAIIVVFPLGSESGGIWCFRNATTGAFTLTVKGGAGSGIAITSAKKVIMAWIGTDFEAYTAEL